MGIFLCWDYRLFFFLFFFFKVNGKLVSSVSKEVMENCKCCRFAKVWHLSMFKLLFQSKGLSSLFIWCDRQVQLGTVTATATFSSALSWRFSFPINTGCRCSESSCIMRDRQGRADIIWMPAVMAAPPGAALVHLPAQPTSQQCAVAPGCFRKCVPPLSNALL